MRWTFSLRNHTSRMTTQRNRVEWPGSLFYRTNLSPNIESTGRIQSHLMKWSKISACPSYPHNKQTSSFAFLCSGFDRGQMEYVARLHDLFTIIEEIGFGQTGIQMRSLAHIILLSVFGSCRGIVCLRNSASGNRDLDINWQCVAQIERRFQVDHVTCTLHRVLGSDFVVDSLALANGLQMRGDGGYSNEIISAISG